MPKLIAGGCSFTFGNELSDDVAGRLPSKKSWANLLASHLNYEYICTAKGGLGNSAIARRVFTEISKHDIKSIGLVAIMWSFISRYDWAMPRHATLENTRWASISPWDTEVGQAEAFENLSGSEFAQQEWKTRQENNLQTGVKPFADALYKHSANDYHESFLSLKSITWLQNILEKKNIPYFFTLADNSLFYNEQEVKYKDDFLFSNLNAEIDFTKWFSFGERMMGFNQWSLLNDYERATTHPLDKAHQDAVKLLIPTVEKIIGEQDV